MKFFSKTYFILLAIVVFLSFMIMLSQPMLCVSGYPVADEVKLMEACGMDLKEYLLAGSASFPEGQKYMSMQGGGCSTPPLIASMFAAVFAVVYTMLYSITYLVIKKIKKSKQKI